MKKKVILAAGLVLSFSALGLSGCSESSVPLPVAAETQARSALTAERVELIDTKVFGAIAAADASFNVDDLAGRVIGPALAERRFAYQKKNLLGDGNELATLSTKPLQTAVSGNGAYPHVMIQVMEAPEGRNLQTIDVLLQTSARQNWSLWSALTMHPGATMPSISTGETGATIIGPDDSEGFVASPNGALDAYINLLSTGDAQGLTFADDPLRTSFNEGLQNNSNAVSEIGEASQSFARGGDGPYAVRTADGGVIVVGEYTRGTTIHVTREGGSAMIPENHDTAIVATGKANEPLKITDTLTVNYQGTVLLHVPAADAEDKTIHVVASSPSVPVAVENKTGGE